ncbi:hypothetical protein PG999_014607 [Apiospora kogelbergensis]|uniref:Integral membrane protein n=1 Tax=Apiospora kogelbergensis TaxID=1337665 RepID=A0AAW0Q6A5_9PEZI
MLLSRLQLLSKNPVQNRGVLSFFLGFLLLYVLLLVYLREKCFRDPSSAFFRPERARVLSYSSFRKTQAKKFAEQAALHAPIKWAPESSLNNNNNDNGKGGGQQEPLQPDVCIGIGSVDRHGFSYLQETLGSVLEGLDAAERRRVYVVVFLAHSNQSVHEDYGKPWLRNMADALPTYAQDNETLALVRKLEIANDYPAHARKQKIDFSVLLSECAKVNPRYTMTLEDDVIAVDGWYHRTLNAVASAARRTEEMGRDSCSWDGTARSGSPISGGSLMFVITELAVLSFIRWRFQAVRRAVPVLFILLVAGVCTPMLIGLFFASGRSCMLPKKPGVHLMQKYGCCGQGLVFPQQQVVDHLLPMYANTTDDHAAVDTFLEDWANARNSLRWAVTPVLIQHVGGKSSHGVGDQVSGRLTDDMPFDYMFETNDPVKLAMEHQAWVDSLRTGA